jgi:hypothetical protein
LASTAQLGREKARIRPANADYRPQISLLLLLMASARRYSYSPWSFTWTFTRSGKSSARPPARFRERFGVENALDYLIGEKLLNFVKAADQDPDFATESRNSQLEPDVSVLVGL